MKVMYEGQFLRHFMMQKSCRHIHWMFPEEEREFVTRRLSFLPAEEENTLEEFAWAYGDQVVEENRA